MKVGPPTKYNSKTLPKVWAYVKECEDEVYIFQKQKGKVEGFEEKIRTHLPTVVGLALKLGVSKETVYVWAKENQELSDALTRIKSMQEQALLNGGLSNRYNPLITKLILATNHGYHEKKDITSDGKQIQVPIYGGLSVQGHDGDAKDIPAA